MLGSDANNCSVSAPCRTLMGALGMTNGGGEMILLNSGDYGQATIAQPVTISATGIDASITATSGNALTINTPGNVTIRGLALHGLGTGNAGVLVQQAGILRFDVVTAESFSGAGVWMNAPGDLAIYDSRFTDNAQGMVVEDSLANVYVHHTSFDNNAWGVYAGEGVTVVTDGSAHFNGTGGFGSDGGGLVLARDRSVFNYYGIVQGQFSSCSIAFSTLYSYAEVPTGTSPGSSVVIGSGNNTLASPSVLQ